MHGSPPGGPAGMASPEEQPSRAQSGRHASGIRRVRRPWAAGAAVGGVVALCIGAAGLAWASHTGKHATPPTPLTSSGLVAIPRGQWAAVPQSSAAPPAPKPTSLDIPVIGVRTKLIHLGLTASGALQVPPTTAVAGWYTGSPSPGAVGAAVILGHIDSVSGPGVFYRLRLLRPGNLVYVRRADGSLAVFRVTAVRTYLKARFPTSAVYGAVPNAQLRLITCGGTFDYLTHHYLSNVIAFATLVTRA
jgi:hypothetical protein